MLNKAKSLLELHNLSCERDERLLFAGLSMAFDGGEAVQIIGPNGAGKTTLLRAISGISHDYSGEIHFKGRSVKVDAWEFQQASLYLGHLAGIKKVLTPAENLAWYAAQSGASQPIAAALKAVGLFGYEDTPCYQLSAGQLRRVALARLHLSSALIWILDEPFTAIDKAGVDQLEQLISQQCERGGLVLLTSHQDLSLKNLRQVDLQDYQPSDPFMRVYETEEGI
jgi:heme exporter protein A